MYTANLDLVTSNILASWSGLSHLISVFCFFFAMVGAIRFFRKHPEDSSVTKFSLSIIVIIFSMAFLTQGGKSHEGDIVLYGWSPLFATVFEWITAIVAYYKTSLHQAFVDIGALFAPGTTNNAIRFRSGLSFVYGLSAMLCFLSCYYFAQVLIVFYSYVISIVASIRKRFFTGDPKRIDRHRLQYASTKTAGAEVKVKPD